MRSLLHVPETDGPVGAAADQRLAVAHKGESLDPLRVPRECLQVLAARGVPEPNRVVGGPRGDRLAIGRVADDQDRSRMADELGNLALALHVPDGDVAGAAALPVAATRE